MPLGILPLGVRSVLAHSQEIFLMIRVSGVLVDDLSDANLLVVEIPSQRHDAILRRTSEALQACKDGTAVVARLNVNGIRGHTLKKQDKDLRKLTVGAVRSTCIDIRINHLVTDKELERESSPHLLDLSNPHDFCDVVFPRYTTNDCEAQKVTTAYNKVANSEFVNQSLQSLQDAKAKVDMAFEEAMKQNSAQLPQGSSTSSSSTAARYHGDQLTVAPAFDSDFPVLGPSPPPPSARQERSPRREVSKAREARRSGEPTTQQNASKGLFDDDEFDVFMLGEGDTSHAAQSSRLTSAPHPKHDEASWVKDSNLSPDALPRPSPPSMSGNIQDILDTTGSWNGGGSSGVQTAAADAPSSGGDLISNDLLSGSERESSQPSSATPIAVEALVESGKDVEGHRHHTENPQLALAAREAPTAVTTSSAHLEDQAVAPAALSESGGSTGTMSQTTEKGTEVVQAGTPRMAGAPPLPGEPASPLNEDNTSLASRSEAELKPSEAELELSDEQIVPSSQEPLLQFQPVDAYTASTDALVSVETIQAPRPTEPSADQVSSGSAGLNDTATLPSGAPSDELPASADESSTPPEVPALGGPSDIEGVDGDQRGAAAAAGEPAESSDAQSHSLHAINHKESTVDEITGPTSEAQATTGGSIPSEPESRPQDVASSEDNMEGGVEPTDGDANTEEAPKEMGEDLTGRLNAEATDATALSEIDDRSPGLSGVNEIPSDSHTGVSEGREAPIDTDAGSVFAQRSDSQCRASQNEELPDLVAKSQSPSRRGDTSAMSDSGDKLNSEHDDEEVMSQGAGDSGAGGADLSLRDMSEGEDNDASPAAESSEGGSRDALETATTAVNVSDKSCPATQADSELLITAAEGAPSVAARGSCPEQTSTGEQEGASGIAGPQKSEEEVREATAGHGDTSGTGKCSYVGEAPSEILEGIDIPELSDSAAAGPTQEYSASAPAVEGEDVEYEDLGPVGRRLMSMEGFIDTVRDRAGSTFSSRARSSSDTEKEQAKMTGPREDESSVLEDLTSNLLEDSKGSGEDVEHIVLGEGSPAVADANKDEDAGHSSTGESRSGEEHEVNLVGLESSEGKDAIINGLRDEVEELKSRLRSREEQLEAHAKTIQMILEEGNKAEVNSQAFRDLESKFYATTEELSDVKAVAATREKHILKLQEDVREQSQEAEDAREETQRILEEGKKLAQRLANLEQKQKSRLQQLDAAKKEKDKLRAELDNAQQKFKDLGDASAESAALREQMQKDRQKMKAHLASVVAEKNKAEGDLAAAKEKINQYQREKEDLLSGQKLTESELERASAELSATQKELLSSQRQSAEEINRLQTELEETQRALTKSQSDSESGTYGTLTSGEQRAVDAEAERDSLQVELGNIRRELSDARGKLESSKDKASELRKEISSLKVEVEKLKAVQGDKDKDAARLSNALEEIGRLQGQLRQSEARVSEVAGKLRSSETEKRTTVEEARTTKLRVEELEEQLKAAQEGLQEAQSSARQQPDNPPFSESTSVEPSFTRNTASSSSSYTPRGGLELERHCKELERKFEVSLQALGQLQEELDESKEVAAMYKSMLRSQVEDDTASTSHRHQP
ncbi:hypothetical protein FOZ62_009627 [Perkinsus olseni]|uniref:Uncharacterized protein n=3 Tax=Perkinsus olseni TaxID=32597 RepID=A0A7J6QZ85_PEROL|nr:hypothetical protein FOZ62_009627 [Perkinsus olseni]